MRYEYIKNCLKEGFYATVNPGTWLYKLLVGKVKSIPLWILKKQKQAKWHCMFRSLKRDCDRCNNYNCCTKHSKIQKTHHRRTRRYDIKSTALRYTNSIL